MKMFLILSLLIFSATSRSQQQQQPQILALPGYLNVDAQGKAYFIAVNVQKQELSAVLPTGLFDRDQLALMLACMKLKEKNTIVVDQLTVTQSGVPTSVPGQTTTTHFPTYVAVECIRAPGFLNVWRNIVSKSSLR